MPTYAQARIVGAKMAQAIAYVGTHPGCSKIDVVRAVSPESRTPTGYAVVNRCIASGHITGLKTRTGYKLRITPYGKEFLDWLSQRGELCSES